MNPIFAVPIQDKFLIYAPLQKISALVNRTAALMIRDALIFGQDPPKKVSALCAAFNAHAQETPEPRRGSLEAPLFLGLNSVDDQETGCVFADCAASAAAGSVMSLETAERALDAYFEIITRSGQPQADIRVFGGEDSLALDLLFFVEAFARQRAQQAEMRLYLNLITHGRLPSRIARWAGDHYDRVTLCLSDVQEIVGKESPLRFERSFSPQVLENAYILSESPADLTLRVCITRQTIQRMGDLAGWIKHAFIPKAVCFQTWLPPCETEADFDEPDPVRFALAFNLAAHELEACGILALHRPADIRTARISPCPVGEDALIISPEGQVNACTLPSTIWQANALSFQLGGVTPHGFEIDPVALNDTRALTVLKAPVCEGCISLFHCAGGCYAHSPWQKDPERFSDRCLQTRLVTISNLLRAMDQFEAARDWLASYSPAPQGYESVTDLIKDLA